LFYDLKIIEMLEEWNSERVEAGDFETARMHRQIWPKIGEVFEKFVEILGEERISANEFAKILDAGLNYADLGMIPPSVDQVFFGGVGRSRFPEIKALLVIGCNEGKLPSKRGNGGLFTDDERAFLSETQMKLAPDNARGAAEDMFSLYCALCKPSEKLIFSYSAAEAGGKALKRARVLDRVCDMFPYVRETDAPDINEYETFEAKSPPARIPANLSSETLERIYGHDPALSASRLEKYAACPFAYYSEFNLRAREREVYSVQPTDLGVLFHEVLARFSKAIADEKISWGSLDRESIKQRADACVEAVVPEYAALRGSARYRHVMRKVKRICNTSIWALSEHYRRGAFESAGLELEVGFDSPIAALEIFLNGDRRMRIVGRIDRVDVLAADDETRYVKIIDYKSGKNQFNLSEALLGTQLQLILYMNALVKNGAEFFGCGPRVSLKPGGIYYFHIDDPILEWDKIAGKKDEYLLSFFKMSGLTLDDPAAIDGIDAGLRENGKSNVIAVTYNSDGKISKKSPAKSAEEFNSINDAVLNKAKELGERMTKGYIGRDPVKKSRSNPCDYCGYGGLCRNYEPM